MMQTIHNGYMAPTRPPVAPADVVRLGLEFADRLGQGVAPTSIEWTVPEGITANDSAIESTYEDCFGNYENVAWATFSGFVSGESYALACTATGPGGEKSTLSFVQPCSDAL